MIGHISFISSRVVIFSLGIHRDHRHIISIGIFFVFIMLNVIIAPISSSRITAVAIMISSGSNSSSIFVIACSCYTSSPQVPAPQPILFRHLFSTLHETCFVVAITDTIELLCFVPPVSHISIRSSSGAITTRHLSGWVKQPRKKLDDDRVLSKDWFRNRKGGRWTSDLAQLRVQ